MFYIQDENGMVSVEPVTDETPKDVKTYETADEANMALDDGMMGGIDGAVEDALAEAEKDLAEHDKATGYVAPLPVVNANMTPIAHAELAEENIYQNDIAANFLQVQSSNGWSYVEGIFSFEGKPSQVEFNIHINATDKQEGGDYWATPKLVITEAVSGWKTIVQERAMQDSNKYDGDLTMSANPLHFQPPRNPQYSFKWIYKGERKANIVSDPSSYIQLRAMN